MEKERNKLPDELARQEFDAWDGTATAPQMANEGAAAASINSRQGDQSSVIVAGGGLMAAARMASDQLETLVNAAGIPDLEYDQQMGVPWP